MPLVVLGIIGSILYGIYWVIINYWPFLLAGAFAIWVLPQIARYVSGKWKTYQAQLVDQQKCEQGQNELFSRFSDKSIKMRPFHPVYVLFVIIGFVVAAYAVTEAHDYARSEGWMREIPRDYRDVQYVIWAALFCVVTISVFSIITKIISRIVPGTDFYPTYGQMLKEAHKANSAYAALEIAPSLRAASKYHVRSLYDFFVAGHALFSKSDDTAFYKNARLLDALNFLETHYPHDNSDETFRLKYWNYARHIFKLLHFRECENIEDSFFALPYPEDENLKEQELKERLKTEREKFQNEPIIVWSKTPDQITLNDALEIVGLSDVPPLKILHKLHLAVAEDHKDDPKKQKLTAKAFEILGREAVQKEMG